MSKTPANPRLTPQFCFNQRALRDFLRLSRAALDDRISGCLNALPPDTISTSSPSPCNTFITTTLFPTWQQRSAALDYCAEIAASPAPQPPNPPLPTPSTSDPSSPLAQQPAIFDPRLDPYTGRPNAGFSDARNDSLATLIRNERSVETIIRARTWGIVLERCGEDVLLPGGGGGSGEGEGEAAEQSFERWRRDRGS